MTDRQAQPEPGPVTANCGGVVFSCWPRLLPLRLAATYLGVSYDTLKKNGASLPRLRAGRKVLYDRDVLDRWLNQLPPGADIWVDARKPLSARAQHPR